MTTMRKSRGTPQGFSGPQVVRGHGNRVSRGLNYHPPRLDHGGPTLCRVGGQGLSALHTTRHLAVPWSAFQTPRWAPRGAHSPGSTTGSGQWAG
ncbi:unnamed protein product [Lota lota]